MENISYILMMVDQWYPETCNSLGLKHILHTPFEKSIVERAIEYVKDRTEGFDD
jgi:putative transposase